MSYKYESGANSKFDFFKPEKGILMKKTKDSDKYVI